MRFQIITFTIGILLTIIGVMELIPALVDWQDDHVNASDFFVCSMVSLFFGGVLTITSGSSDTTITVRQTFLLTTLSWLFMSLFSAFPLYMSDLNISFTDAFFEAVSGITTTGSTVLSGLDGMSRGILLWRSLIQWIGGIGIVAFAIVMLPFLRVGGMQLFQTESSDRSEKVMPRSTAVVGTLIKVYCLLTGACALSYYVLGMSGFDAINHALTTIPTGGYSTHDASFGYFQSPMLQYAATLFMFLGGVPFVLYIKLLFQGQFTFFKDDQFVAILAMLSAFTAIITVWLWYNSDYSLATSFRYSVFNIVSVVTTTGFATTDYTLWGPFAVMAFFFMTYLGACAGSTTGGVKVMRLVIVAKTVRKQLFTLMHPHGVYTIRYQGKPLDNAVSLMVLGFLGMYVAVNTVITLALMASGIDFATAVSGTATALANVGPGVGDIIGPSGNFSSLPDMAKWLLSAAMVLGRLEIMTVIVLFIPDYWRS